MHQLRNHSLVMRLAATPIAVITVAAGFVALGATTAQAVDCSNPLSGTVLTAGGRTASTLAALAPQPGETITATVTYRSACVGRYVGLATYRAPTSKFDTSKPTQELYQSAQTNRSGSISVVVPTPAGTPGPGCTNTHDLTPGDGGGANTSGPYDTTCDGTPSANGNGSSSSRPCAGCVGNADDKNPPGQLPGPQDKNNGYECDGNNGIAKGNPAHSGCTDQDHYQADLFVGDTSSAQVIQELSASNRYGSRLLSSYNG